MRCVDAFIVQQQCDDTDVDVGLQQMRRRRVPYDRGDLCFFDRLG